MKKKISKLSLKQLELQMEVIPPKEMFTVVGGKEINMDRHGVVLSTTDEHQGWTYINIVERDYFGGGYNSFKVINTWSTQGDIDRYSGITYDRYTGNTSDALFEFLCQYTDVEWGIHKSQDEDYYPIIETSFGNDYIYPGNYDGYDTFIHNHDEGDYPSPGDRDAQKYDREHYGYEYFLIYDEQNNQYVFY